MPDAALPQALYHLNPHALGSLETAAAELGHIAELGFDAVCLASPFDAAPGEAGLLRDPSRLQEGLGGGEALPALAQLAE
ncbi:hypothetical protein, partial [Teichococcus cervicalis]